MARPGSGGPPEDDLTTLLNRLPGGDVGTNGDAFDPTCIPMEELHRTIHQIVRRIRRPRADHRTAQTTDLAHRILERTVLGVDSTDGREDEGRKDPLPTPRRWTDREHFFNHVAWLTVKIMLDDYRKATAQKRGGAIRHEPLEQVAADDRVGRPRATADDPVSDEAMIELLRCFERLRALDPRAATIVTLRFVSGLTVDEVALAIGISTKTVCRDWSVARAWLFEELAPHHPELAAQFESPP